MDQEVLKEIGEELRKKRKSLSLTIEEVSKKLKIRKAYLQGLEKGDVSLIPFEPYVIGYVKHYAKLLGIDLDAQIQKLKSETKQLETPRGKNMITEKEFMPSIILVIITLLLTACIYGILLFIK